MMGRIMTIRVFFFFGVLVVHWIAQFLLWGQAERTPSVRLLWNILASPLIHLAGSLSNQYFWVIASLNSFVWAAVFTYVFARITGK